MTAISFEWDPQKAALSRRKHRVSFEEARSVFFDEQAVQFIDESHSTEEERYLMLGVSMKFRLLLVTHTYRERDSMIRIISAKRATVREAREYPGGMR